MELEEREDVIRINDVNNGKYEYTYSNGDKETGTYYRGIRNGKYERHYTNGLVEIGQYIKGKRVPMNVYNKEGELVRSYQ